jgi:NAD(P)-dependent dehydrogenase (short-subunit alcohol dehydrogenase family)
MDAKPLANRVALVTGASRGIGQATAIALAKRGATIIATVRSPTGLEELENGIRAAGSTLTLVTLDMTDVGGIAMLAADIKQRHGRLDVLVGNAGVPGPNLGLTEVSPKDWDEAMFVNLTANWHLVRYFDALLRASQAGRVVFVSSGSAARVAARRGPYSISKAALEAMARTYANETASSNVRVNLFNPGPIRTRMRATVAPKEDPMILDTPEQCAEKLVALCLPSYNETGRLYDYIIKDFIEFRKPTLAVGPTG